MTAAAALFASRAAPAAALAAEAEAVVAAAKAVAGRVAAGGAVLAFGEANAAADAHHIAVEFVHPVIVGKRAVPARVVTAADAAATAGAADALLALAWDDPTPALSSVLARARECGVLTVALLGDDDTVVADHCLRIPGCDWLEVRELHVTTYHLLWELVHLFLEIGSA